MPVSFVLSKHDLCASCKHLGMVSNHFACCSATEDGFWHTSVGFNEEALGGHVVECDEFEQYEYKGDER